MISLIKRLILNLRELISVDIYLEEIKHRLWFKKINYKKCIKCNSKKTILSYELYQFSTVVLVRCNKCNVSHKIWLDAL